MAKPGNRHVDRLAWTAGPALAMLPMLNFMKGQGCGLGRPEYLMVLAAFAALGLVPGLLLARGGRVVRALALAVLVAAIVDVQTDWYHAVNLRLLLTLLVAGAAGWLAGRHLNRFLLPIAWAMVAATLLMPGQAATARRDRTPAGDADASLPVVLHVILDGHIGSEGIPREIDAGGRAREALRSTFLGRGFHLYERAYSRYEHTWASLSAGLNFAVDASDGQYCTSPFSDGNRFVRNAWLEELAARGYRLHVYENTCLRLAPVGAAAEADLAAYVPESLALLEGEPWTAGERARSLVELYRRRSWFTDLVGRAAFAAGFSGTWSREAAAVRLSSLAGGAMARDVGRDLAQAAPGHAYFVHVLLPHPPFIYHADGTVRPEPWTWPDGAGGPAARPRRNTPATRAAQYPAYLEQLAFIDAQVAAWCDTLRGLGLWDDALVIVHGDHGSRLDCGPPTIGNFDSLAPSDLRDVYSILAAVKLPRVEGGAVTGAAPLERILAAAAADSAAGTDPAGAPQQVFIGDDRGLEPRMVHLFADLP